MDRLQQHRPQQKRSSLSAENKKNKEDFPQEALGFNGQKKGKNLLNIIKKDSDKNCKPPFEFLIQSNQYPDNRLCAYFAYYHYMNGCVEKEEFKAKAIKTYLEIIPDEEEALKLFSDGNDPGVYSQFGLSEVNYENALDGEKFIIADVKKGHFYALRKHNDTWWNYDSFCRTAPTLIGDRTAAMNFLKQKGQPVWA
jgi:hypothetical protein